MDAGKRKVGHVNNKWFILSQYSRHIRPGHTIIDGGEGNTIAAMDASDGRLVLVTANYGGACELAYDLSAFSTTGAECTRWTTGFETGSEQYAMHRDCAVSGSTLNVTLAEKSVSTFELHGVKMADVLVQSRGRSPQSAR